MLPEVWILGKYWNSMLAEPRKVDNKLEHLLHMEWNFNAQGNFIFG